MRSADSFPAEYARARHLFLSRRYAEVVRLLAPQIFLFRDDPGYFRMMGIASLNSGDFAGAQSYLLRGIDVAGQDRAMLEGLAVCSLYRKDVTEAARIWLLLQEQQPRNRRAAAGLGLLQASPERTDWPQLLVRPECRELYPQAPFYWKRLLLTVGLLAGGVTLAAGLTLGVLALAAELGKERPAPRVALQSAPTGSPAPGTEAGAFPDIAWELPVEHLEPSEVDALLLDMRNSFNQYRDNKVRRIINRLLLSDAPEKARQQALGLVAHIREPKFTNFMDGAGYGEVLEAPWLHQGTYVRWSGSIAGVRIQADRLEFQFFPGYEAGRVSQGSVPVSLGFPVELGDGMGVELIGRVLVDPETKGRFSLRGTSIRIIKSKE